MKKILQTFLKTILLFLISWSIFWSGVFANVVSTTNPYSAAFWPDPNKPTYTVDTTQYNKTVEQMTNDAVSANAASQAAQGTTSSTAAGPTKIIVTERVPGGDCTCIAEGAKTQWEAACGTPENRKYECTVPQWLAGFQAVFAKIIRYFIYIVLLLGVLGIVGLGMAWAFAGGDDVKMKTTLKHWWVNVLVGLILLFLFSYILMALAPWVFTS